MTDKMPIPPITEADYKKIMSDLGMPESRSLLFALRQVANHAAQYALQQAAKSVPVVGEPVAYGVKDNGVLWTFTTVAEHASRASTMGSEIVPLIIKPINSITHAELDALVSLVEGFDWHDWRNKDGLRLKDTPEWVAFYCAVKRIDAAIAAEGEEK